MVRQYALLPSPNKNAIFIHVLSDLRWIVKFKATKAMTPQHRSYLSRHDKPLPTATCEFSRTSGYYLIVALWVNVQKKSWPKRWLLLETYDFFKFLNCILKKCTKYENLCSQ
jgi:hypothetical protein